MQAKGEAQALFLANILAKPQRREREAPGCSRQSWPYHEAVWSRCFRQRILGVYRNIFAFNLLSVYWRGKAPIEQPWRSGGRSHLYFWLQKDLRPTLATQDLFLPILQLGNLGAKLAWGQTMLHNLKLVLQGTEKTGNKKNDRTEKNDDCTWLFLANVLILEGWPRQFLSGPFQHSHSNPTATKSNPLLSWKLLVMSLFPKAPVAPKMPLCVCVITPVKDRYCFADVPIPVT